MTFQISNNDCSLRAPLTSAETLVGGQNRHDQKEKLQHCKGIRAEDSMIGGKGGGSGSS
jgi:hypothetical protein